MHITLIGAAVTVLPELDLQHVFLRRNTGMTLPQNRYMMMLM
jgi:hypothetical protein